jgi:hypothetical protein
MANGPRSTGRGRLRRVLTYHTPDFGVFPIRPAEKARAACTGEPLRYRLREEGVIVSSVGDHGKDGGGLGFRLWDPDRRRRLSDV